MMHVDQGVGFVLLTGLPVAAMPITGTLDILGWMWVLAAIVALALDHHRFAGPVGVEQIGERS